ncbi:putative U4/U6 small nuclear ribonucleoprotein Prp31 [Apostichopus japonicus]|uniref:U4/U6 small nuclear ribonucleoprotein Prp31 n=1 Tax=Stichopus japonicus TaxID=307972 RepID=A0A2G8L108_STIJA|nr:putative U4/U6 small nuclear ribonucleoprotein Prp31 [Apostichopus japonicus]
MSLADELLADLEEMAEGGDHLEDAEMNDIEDVEEAGMVVESKVPSVRKIAKLRDSDELADVMVKIDKYQKNPQTGPFEGMMEANPEYQLIVQANNLSAEIDNEVNIVHKFVRDNYSKKFPELDSLVPTAFEYLKTVKELGNDLSKAKNNETLQEFLTNAVIMVVSVSASNTAGSELTADELNTIFEACDMAFDLNDYKSKILSYVESRMSFISPNLSIIVGASTAAKLMGAAGGVSNLSKMPACNILVLGAQKKTLSGFSSVATMPHTGYIFYSELVQGTPPDLRKKAAKLVSSKSALAARVDSFHESIDGDHGMRLKEEIERKLAKLQEPPPPKPPKPLPAPIDGQRKRRGGKRVRKMKEKLGMTEFRKAANRMSFGEIEDDAYQEDLGFSLGQIGKSGSGKVRGPQVDNKTQVKISKSLQRQLQKQQMHGGKSTVRGRETSGTASSVAFTPLQGLEIINPSAAEQKVAEANAKYFSATTGFQRVKTEQKL